MRTDQRAASAAQPVYRVHLVQRSENAKTGPIPVSTSSKKTCPKDCGLHGNGCYAESGPLALHWNAVTKGKRGTKWDAFCAAIAALPEGQLWRHNQAGDLPGDGVKIDRKALTKLARASEGKQGFTYTHYRPTRGNLAALRAAAKLGFTVNLSADSLAKADDLSRHGLPVVVVLPVAVQGNVEVRTPGGRRVVVCPATYKDEVSCSTCALCAASSETRPIVGFPAHGSSKRKADAIARGITQGEKTCAA